MITTANEKSKSSKLCELLILLQVTLKCWYFSAYSCLILLKISYRDQWCKHNIHFRKCIIKRKYDSNLSLIWHISATSGSSNFCLTLFLDRFYLRIVHTFFDHVHVRLVHYQLSCLAIFYHSHRTSSITYNYYKFSDADHLPIYEKSDSATILDMLSGIYGSDDRMYLSIPHDTHMERKFLV